MWSILLEEHTYSLRRTFVIIYESEFPVTSSRSNTVTLESPFDVHKRYIYHLNIKRNTSLVVCISTIFNDLPLSTSS